MSLKVAIMQPYFFPYAGYFRLFAAADLFVVFDCVQFPRRGWVHRNQLTDYQGHTQWLTLPLVKGDRDSTRIQDLAFPSDSQVLFSEQLRRFPSMSVLARTHAELLREILDFDRSPVQYLVGTLRHVTQLLGISRPMLLSSDLSVPSELKAQSRIIEIAKRVGARHYINAPGGREIYEPQAFRDAGLTLNFLPDYAGPRQSMLQRLAYESAESIADEITSGCHLDCVT